MVIDLCQGAGSTAEAALRLSCLYIGVDKDPLAEEVVRERIEAVGDDVQVPSQLKTKWANQLKWSIFSKESSKLSVAEVEDGQDGIYLLVFINIIYLYYSL